MKKLIIFSVIFSAFLVGCSNFNDIETVGINNSNNSESNVLRTQFKNALENNAVSFSRSASSVTECNSEVLEVAEDTSTSDFLLENELISSVAAAYISKVENIINDESLSVEDTISNIEEIENDAKSALSKEEYEGFINFSEMSIAAIDYYTENDEAARSIGSWLRKKAKNICCAAISDAIGSFIGWKIGSTIGGITLPVIGYILGGVVGAVSVGVASTVADWKAGGISIKVSWSK